MSSTWPSKPEPLRQTYGPLVSQRASAKNPKSGYRVGRFRTLGADIAFRMW